MRKHKVWLEIGLEQWPYIDKTFLLSGQRENIAFLIETNPNGNIIVSVTSGRIQRQFISQPILINNPGEVELFIEFDVAGNHIGVYLNDKLLLSYSEAKGQGFLSNTVPRAPHSIKYPDLSSILVKDDSEQFFLRTVYDLSKRFNNTDNYETLKIAGLLRLLLLDNPCLIDTVNKKYRLRLEYNPADSRLKTHSPSKHIELFVTTSSLYSFRDGDGFAPAKVRNAFLKVPCAAVGGQIITIEDVILYCAHKAGGVHYDQSLPNKPGQLKILELGKLIKSSDKPNYNRSLHEIAFFTLRGIQPLVHAIIESARSDA
jgi:hypothetical protein